ncbi:MAG: UvrB/UvrC motif-containing protein [Clostridia bacterium]|nr:UvrB/UvrC motif-containing protein [Clostridia bacterium]
MLCSNCGKHEANIRYTRIINGEKTEFALCEECAKKVGLEDIDFSMPINFSNFLSDFFEDDTLLPSFAKTHINKCPKCGLTYDNFVSNGKFGCSECYNTFSNKLDAILKNLHGSSKHTGRFPKNMPKKMESKQSVENEDKKIDEKQQKIDKLNKDLQNAIKEERYEDAAKIRDETKKLQ